MAQSRSRTRTDFPEHLKGLRHLMPKLVQILESGRSDQWYAFAWLEEVRTQMSVCAITETSQESLDRGIVLRALVDGTNYERSTNQLDETSLLALAHEFRLELDKKVPSKEAYQPLSWKQEIARGLDPDFLDQLPKNLENKTEVHFGILCEENPAQTTVATLKKSASALRTKLLDLSRTFVHSEQ
ncbi:MAG: hypothetical protein AABY86_02635, partial [Bdellovibrionota bacterium]